MTHSGEDSQKDPIQQYNFSQEMVVEKPTEASLRGKIIGRIDYGRKC